MVYWDPLLEYMTSGLSLYIPKSLLPFTALRSTTSLDSLLQPRASAEGSRSIQFLHLTGR